MLKIIVIVLLLLFAPLNVFAKDGILNILYTGAIKGELEPCGCSHKSSSGGLARLSGYISANKESLTPYILLDAGNSMGDDTSQGRLKSDVVIKAFATTGYDATAFFDDAQTFIKSFTLDPTGKPQRPALARADTTADSIEIKKDSYLLNISTNPKAYKKDRINILLSDETLSTVKGFTGWDVIILSSGEIIKEPVLKNSTLIVSGYPRGEKLGVLSIKGVNDNTTKDFTHRWQSLDKDIKEDAKIRSLIDRYDIEVAGLIKDEQRQIPEDKTYFGSKSCARCHQPFYDQWRTTRHARAFASLEAVGKAQDPQCVMCHTTGYAKPGGFYSLTTTAELKNVQCEQCHGQGKGHMSDYSVPMTAVNEQVCLGCHTKKNSPSFDFSTYLKKIKH